MPNMSRNSAQISGDLRYVFSHTQGRWPLDFSVGAGHIPCTYGCCWGFRRRLSEGFRGVVRRGRSSGKLDRVFISVLVYLPSGAVVLDREKRRAPKRWGYARCSYFHVILCWSHTGLVVILITYRTEGETHGVFWVRISHSGHAESTRELQIPYALSSS